MRYTVHVGFFFPFRTGGGRVGDNGAFGIAAADFFDDPHALHAEQLDIKDACANQSVHQQRLRFLETYAMDDAMFLRVQACTNGFGKIRMSGQNQKCFHGSRITNRQKLISIPVTALG